MLFIVEDFTEWTGLLRFHLTVKLDFAFYCYQSVNIRPGTAFSRKLVERNLTQHCYI